MPGSSAFLDGIPSPYDSMTDGPKAFTAAGARRTVCTMSSRLGVLAVAGFAALGLVACGDDDEDSGGAASTPATQTQTTQTHTTQTQTTPAERPVTLQVNGEPRVVTLSRVNFAYCNKKTDVCAAIRGASFQRLTPVGQRAVRQARRRKAAREAAEREAARQRELEQQQQEQAPPPQSEPEGTGTGS
jgi:hypothetical protein